MARTVSGLLKSRCFQKTRLALCRKSDVFSAERDYFNSLSRGCPFRHAMPHGWRLVWIALLFHGARRLPEFEKLAPPHSPCTTVRVLTSERDSTWVKVQQRPTPKTRARLACPFGPLLQPSHPMLPSPGVRPASGSPVNLSGSPSAPLAQFRLAFHCLAPCLLRPALHRLLRHENQGLQHLHQKVSDQAAVLLDR